MSRAIRAPLFALLYAAVILASVEAASRVYLHVTRGMPLLHPRHLIYSVYPQLRQVVEAPVNGDTYDVLLLGGSVLTTLFGTIPQELHEQLARDLHRTVRVFNLSETAHGTLDSYYKYRACTSRKFDLVVVYHAINDVRANNCPPGVFRDDYSHYAWYREVKAMTGYPLSTAVTFPFSFQLLLHQGPDKTLNRGELPHAWLGYGGDIKTARAFRRNMEAIVKLAQRKREMLVIMTFANYIPADYTEQKFRDKALDYGEHLVPLELWGLPQNVRAGIDAHNAVIEAIAREHPELIFLDQNALIPKGKRYFNDVAHLTPEGCRMFVGNIVTALGARETGGRQ